MSVDILKDPIGHTPRAMRPRHAGPAKTTLLSMPDETDRQAGQGPEDRHTRQTRQAARGAGRTPPVARTAWDNDSPILLPKHNLPNLPQEFETYPDSLP